MARKAAAHVKEGVSEIEAPAVSLDDDVEIDLGATASNGVTPPAKQQAVPQVPDIEVVEAPAAAPVVPAQEDEEKASMRRRLQELEAAERTSRETIASAQAAQAESVRQRQQAEARARQFEESAAQDRYDSIVNAMGAAQSELESAKQTVETVGEQIAAGGQVNWKALADAQERIGRYSSTLQQLENDKNRMDAARDAEKNRPQPSPQPQPQLQVPDPHVTIANSGLPEKIKGWLRQHIDYMTEPAKNAKMQEMHWVAKYQTGEEFTDAYVDRMEVLLGLKQETQSTTSGQNGTNSQPQPRSVGQVSAPPTREAPSMATGRTLEPTKVRLSPAQREQAAILAEVRGWTQAEGEREYARQLLKINAEKAAGTRT